MTSRSTDLHHVRYKDSMASETVGYDQRETYIGFRYDAPNLARDALRLFNIDNPQHFTLLVSQPFWSVPQRPSMSCDSCPSSQDQHVIRLL